MNRPLATKKSQTSLKMIMFWSTIALLTLAFMVFVVVKFVEANQEVHQMDDLTNLTADQIFDREGTYYIYAYSKVGVTEGLAELDKAEDLEETILTYLTYVRRNSDANKMFGMIVESYENASCLIDGDLVNTSVLNKTTFSGLKIHKEDLPILMRIESGKVAAAFLTESDIREELQTAMNG
jgi:hypothetical protein